MGARAAGPLQGATARVLRRTGAALAQRQGRLSTSAGAGCRRARGRRDVTVDVSPFLEPRHCAVVVFECQQMVLGDDGPFAGLVASARAAMFRQLPGLLDAARAAGAAVVYCTVSGRPGGLGAAKVPLQDRLSASGAGR